jgi:hypothetical protein
MVCRTKCLPGERILRAGSKYSLGCNIESSCWEIRYKGGPVQNAGSGIKKLISRRSSSPHQSTY